MHTEGLAKATLSAGTRGGVVTGPGVTVLRQGQLHLQRPGNGEFRPRSVLPWGGMAAGQMAKGSTPQLWLSRVSPGEL